jgi:ubiquinone/menaquinone biosynthesis C-methylase UbiE
VPRFDDDWIDFILRPDRRESPPADALLDLIGVDVGAVLADIGCGPGFLTLPAARRVGLNGKVYAIDVEPKMLELVSQAAAAEQLTNVECRQSSGLPIPLGDAVADVTICALVLHDLDDPHALARELARVTRPSGHIAIIEWTPAVDDARRNRVPPEVTARLLRAVGREPNPPVHLSNHQYLIVAS